MAWGCSSPDRIVSASLASSAGRAGIPSRYAREDTTPLEVTVGPTGGTFDLELADDKP